MGCLSGGECERFDKSESWVSRRLALVSELPEPVQELVRSGGLPAHAAMKHLVPLARAKAAGWQALGDRVGRLWSADGGSVGACRDESGCDRRDPLTAPGSPALAHGCCLILDTTDVSGRAVGNCVSRP